MLSPYLLTTVCQNEKKKGVSKITFKETQGRRVIALNECFYFSVLKFVSLSSRVLINLKEAHDT